METVTYDPNEWQLVPKIANNDMIAQFFGVYSLNREVHCQTKSASALFAYSAMLDEAPRHPSITAAGWQPVESEPEDHGYYLCCIAGSSSPTRMLYFGHPNGERRTAWYAEDYGGDTLQPTHWMSIPAPLGLNPEPAPTSANAYGTVAEPEVINCRVIPGFLGVRIFGNTIK